MGQPSAGTIVSASVSTAAVVQLARRLALYASIGVGIPVAHSESLFVTTNTALNGTVQIQQTLHHWDFYANASFSDFTRGVYPFFSTGFVHRWRG